MLRPLAATVRHDAARLVRPRRRALGDPRVRDHEPLGRRRRDDPLPRGPQGHSRSLYEAATIDGAGQVRQFWNVTLPMLSPLIFYNVVMGIIGSFQVFTQAKVMTDGGPNDCTLFYVLNLYRQAFEFHNMGYASAMAWVLFLIVLGLTIAGVPRLEESGLLRGAQGVTTATFHPPCKHRSMHARRLHADAATPRRTATASIAEKACDTLHTAQPPRSRTVCTIGPGVCSRAQPRDHRLADDDVAYTLLIVGSTRRSSSRSTSSSTHRSRPRPQVQAGDFITPPESFADVKSVATTRGRSRRTR